MGQDPNPPQAITENNFRNYEDDDKPNKKEFLRRKSQKAPVAVATKKYNYYVDNFEESKKREPRSTSQAPDKSSGLSKGDET